MSEQKDKRKYRSYQPKTFSSIHQSRIIYSYPLLTSTRKQIPSTISPRKMNRNLQIIPLIDLKEKQIGNAYRQQRTPSIDKYRPKSLDFKNNLFSKLASKIHMKKQTEYKRKDEVINQYYDQGSNKQNKNKSNLHSKADSSSKMNIKGQKIDRLTKNRYGKPQQTTAEKQKIKFNKIKPISINKRNEDQLDFVRVSDAQLKVAKTSLQMKPII